MSEDLDSLMGRVHGGIAAFDFDGREVPCITLEEGRFDSIMRRVAGRPLSVNTDLNILQDGLGHVFVEVTLAFSEGGFAETLLINARESLGFFELLADTSILALSSPRSGLGRDRVFMIQLPRPEKAAGALEIIRRGLSCGRGRGGGAATGARIPRPPPTGASGE